MENKIAITKIIVMTINFLKIFVLRSVVYGLIVDKDQQPERRDPQFVAATLPYNLR